MVSYGGSSAASSLPTSSRDNTTGTLIVDFGRPISCIQGSSTPNTCR
jgi:hypothetical protein